MSECSQNAVGVCTAASGDIVSEAAVADTLSLTAGSDTATAVFRDGGATGPIRAKISCVTGTTKQLVFPKGCRFTQSIYVTLTGTSPVVCCSVPMPKARQLGG